MVELIGGMHKMMCELQKKMKEMKDKIKSLEEQVEELKADKIKELEDDEEILLGPVCNYEESSFKFKDLFKEN